MLFNTTQFFVFLAVVLALFYTCPRPWRKVILLAASYFFYMSWNVKFVFLLLTLTVIDYTAGIWIPRVRPERRKLLLICSLSANLGFLGFFKYYNFLLDNLVALLKLPPHSFALDIILPLGLSFHTFQSMSYVVDVYRGQQEPIRNPIDYALFISFFPQLVAGPIVRAREFFADFYHWRAPSGEEILRGTLMVVFGLAKKMVVADQFARIADIYFKQPSAHPGMLAAWSGVLAFSMQIYFDFSGYTDMAIGIALILGFHFPMNFRRPYLADSITEFWRRWHMSLSRWLRDYLYVPLGGNRHGRLQTYRNLMLTMLLGGLWHGASWNFVVWGGYHGALLSLEKATGLPGRKTPLLTPLRIAIAFTLASLGWVFFRAADLPTSGYIIGQMFTGGASHMLWYHWQLWLILSILVLTVFQEKLDWFERLITAPAWVYATVVAFLLLSVELIGVTDVAVPFVYFQF